MGESSGGRKTTKTPFAHIGRSPKERVKFPMEANVSKEETKPAGQPGPSPERRPSAPIGGTVAPGFEPVAEAFAANFAERGDVGAACSLVWNGQPVVDLWGGWTDRIGGQPWQPDTTTIVFSATKGVTASIVHLLAQRGDLDLHRPIASYWPEFAAAGKAEITIACVLAHRAGLPTVEADLTLDQVLAWHPIVEAIAAQAPQWAPGSAHGYHVRTFGWILGEVVRRVTGASIGTFLREQICVPRGLHLSIGTTASQQERKANLLPPGPDSVNLEDILGSDSLTSRALSGPSNLFSYSDMWNDPKVLAAELPSSNGVSDARSLAGFYGSLIGSVNGHDQLLSTATIGEANQIASQGADNVLLVPTRFGAGYMLAPFLVAGGGRKAFGHSGAGGSLAFADPEAGFGFAYVMNQMKLEAAPDARPKALVDAVYACLRRADTMPNRA
jgi:CubicO group peptidase (beta-lactamase class C family)